MGQDITLQRFQAATDICGFVPREFLKAVKSPSTLGKAKQVIRDAIKSCRDIASAMDDFIGDLKVPHCAFLLCPGDEQRTQLNCLVKPVSDWAMDCIDATLDERSEDAAYKLYVRLEGSPSAASFRGTLWERRVHRYFRSLPTPWSFTIRALSDSSTLEWGPFEDMNFFNFVPGQMLAGHLAQCVAAGNPGYLRPVSSNFTSFDCIVYRPTDALAGLLVTTTHKHLVKAKGLEGVQALLSPRNPLLSSLRPTVGKPWIILFVVPSPMNSSYITQQIDGGSPIWLRKTAQYVLGLDVQKVLHRSSK